ncbi:MAG: restriction endonuclease subunit S [Porphyromonas sp.]|nr:restriction endonuclease subunit S [Porphyromonas sp.]
MATNNKIPNCPPLRFPEFSSPWMQTSLGKILSIGNGRDYKHLSRGDIPVFGTGGYMTSVDQFLMDGESVFIGRKGTIDKPFYHNGKFWTVDTLFYTHSFINSSPRFVLYLFNNINWLEYNEASGVPSLSKTTISKIPICFPQLAEQEKIASFLSLIDERIQCLSETIAEMKSLRLGVYQSILCKRRAHWEIVYLKDILVERGEKNTSQLDVFSVSVSKGIVNQVEHLGRSFAAKNTQNYNVVHHGDLVYTKSPTGDFPYGIVKQSKIGTSVAVSPLYGVYIPQNYHIGVMIHNFFLSALRTSNYLAPLVQKGAKNTMNITTQHFLDNKIVLPLDTVEQQRISSLITLLDERIELEEQLLQQYEQQKKYLLRQMFI